MSTPGPSIRVVQNRTNRVSPVTPRITETHYLNECQESERNPGEEPPVFVTTIFGRLVTPTHFPLHKERKLMDTGANDRTQSKSSVGGLRTKTSRATIVEMIWDSDHLSDHFRKVRKK